MVKTTWKKVGLWFLLVILVLGVPLAVASSDNDDGLVVTDMTEWTAEELVESLLGGGVEVMNVQLTGVNVSSGYFTGGENIIGFEEGIILSTGSVHNVVGPNTSNEISRNNGLPGDSDLNALIPGYSTFDATVLEFEFIPENDVISFEYVFASDEYNQWVNSSYNDVFGFFINGENEAKLPGTDIVVSINNVNGGRPFGTGASNPDYYRNNSIVDPGPATINTEMDGLTVVLSVQANVNAGEVNHIKMAIADAGDYALDSNVFIKAGSFTDQPIQPVDPVDPPEFGFTSITGGGQVTNDDDGRNSDNRSFGFNVHANETGLHVNLNYNASHRGNSNRNNVDATSPTHIKARGYASNIEYVEDDDGNIIGVEFEIPVTVRTLHDNNERVMNLAHVRLVDRGQPGQNDEFQLTIIDGPSEGYVSGLQTITNGNIKIHH